jgi:hypothetical protein
MLIPVGRVGRIGVMGLRAAGPSAAPFVGILDNLPPSAGAWSVSRRLRTGYTGPLIRDRRSSDNAEQDIGLGVDNNLDSAARAAFLGPENLLLHSEAFDNAYWTKIGASVTANSVANPLDGSLTADTITISSATTLVFGRARVIPNTTYTFSVWLRSITGTYNLKLSRTNTLTWVGSTLSPVFTLDTTWQRYSLTFTTGASETLADCLIGSEQSTPFATINGSFYAFGAQLNVGSVAGVYQPTTAAIHGVGFNTTFYDHSGNGNHFTQATAASQPRMAAFGGRHALFFDGLDDSMARALNAELVPPYTINVVANRIAGGNYQRVLSGSPDSRLLVGALNGNYISTTGDGVGWNGIAAANTPLTQIASAPRVLTVIVEAGSTSPFIDGVAMAVRNNTLNANSLLSLILGGQTNQRWNGGVFEVVVFASALSTADRQALERDQGDLYGINVA